MTAKSNVVFFLVHFRQIFIQNCRKHRSLSMPGNQFEWISCKLDAQLLKSNFAINYAVKFQVGRIWLTYSEIERTLIWNWLTIDEFAWKNDEIPFDVSHSSLLRAKLKLTKAAFIRFCVPRITVLKHGLETRFWNTVLQKSVYKSFLPSVFLALSDCAIAHLILRSQCPFFKKGACCDVI